MTADYTPTPTPIEVHAGIRVKRDDAWTRGGASGAKARAMFAMAESAPGLISAGSRISPQLERAALVARALGIPARLHTAAGRDTPEIRTARAAGAEILGHTPGRLSVLRARFRTDAAARPTWAAVPFGMEHPTYLAQVAAEAASVPAGARLVVPVGSGMTLAGILRGLPAGVAVLGVRVGGDPTACLDRHAAGWRARVRLASSPYTYETPSRRNRLGDLVLDPHYEAKCLPFLREADVLWCVGLRCSAA